MQELEARVKAAEADAEEQRQRADALLQQLQAVLASQGLPQLQAAQAAQGLPQPAAFPRGAVSAVSGTAVPRAAAAGSRPVGHLAGAARDSAAAPAPPSRARASAAAHGAMQAHAWHDEPPVGVGGGGGAYAEEAASSRPARVPASSFDTRAAATLLAQRMQLPIVPAPPAQAGHSAGAEPTTGTAPRTRTP